MIRRSFTRNAFILFGRTLLACAVAWGLRITVMAAEVSTDQADYPPGATAFITGIGFAPGEWVVLQVIHTDGTPEDPANHQPWSIEADAGGAFATGWVVGGDSLGATLLLTAVGQTSGFTAQTTFTDAPFFGVRLVSVASLGAGCTRTVSTTTNVQAFVRPGLPYRFTFSLGTNGTPPPCFVTTNASGPPTIVMSLGPDFGNATFVAVRVGTANLYTNNVFVPSSACSTTPITFSCDSGSVQQVLGNAPPDRPVQLVASLNCSNVLSCGPVPPVLNCVSNLSISTDASNCSAVVFYSLPAASGSPSPAVNCTPPPGATFPVGVSSIACIASNSAGVATCTFTITVRDTGRPVLVCPSSLSVPTDPGSCSAVVSYTPLVSDGCPGAFVVCAPPSGSTFVVGTHFVNCIALDAAGNSALPTNGCFFTIQVFDSEPPTVSCPPLVSISGCQGTVPDAAGLVVVADNCASAGQCIITQTPAAGTVVGVGSTPILVTVRDPANNTAQCVTVLAVANTPPAISSLTGSGLVALGVPAGITVDFTDPDAGQAHSVVFDWGDGTTDTMTLAAGTTTATGSHGYAAPGVYTVTATVSDSCAGVSAAYEFMVVYDPDGGFVTGGGWIDSPAGAYTSNPALTGKANFGFVAKYHPGAQVPSGQTEFQFKAGDFNFRSTDYEWLVVTGAKAQYKGTGTINGAGPYDFRLTLTDGQVAGGGGVDKFRIKITGPGGVIYDNRLGNPDGLNTADPQEIAGGSIVIHK